MLCGVQDHADGYAVGDEDVAGHALQIMACKVPHGHMGALVAVQGEQAGRIGTAHAVVALP